MAEQLFFKASDGGRILKANAGTVSSSSGNMSAEDFWKGRGFSTITPQEFKARESAFSQLGIKQAKKVSSQDLSRLDAFVAQQLKPLDQQVGAGGLKDTRALSPEESTAQAQERFFNDPANVSTQPDFKIASGPITAPKFGDELVVDGQRISPQDPNYETFAKQQGITKPTDSLIDINDVGDPGAEPVIQKSTEMNAQLEKVNKTIADFTLDAGANKNFVQGAIFAKTGKDATAEQLAQFTGKTLREVIEAIDLDVEGGGAIPADQVDRLASTGVKSGEAISDPEQLSNFKESDIARTTEGNIYRRDLAKEELALKDFISRFGQPKTESDWKKFHDFVYEPGALESKDLTTSTITDPAPTDTPTVTDPTGAPTDAPGATGVSATGSALDKTDELANNFLSDKTAIRTGAKEGAGVSEIQTAINEASKISNDYQTKIEQMQADLNLQDILNDETRIALESKVTGQGIPMKTINRQLTKEMNDLSQEQRIDRLYDVYELNTQINAFNAQNRQVQMLNGQYDRAMENVQSTVDDWTEMQNLKLDVLEQQGVLEKEARAQAQGELDFQRDLRLEGYTPINDNETFNKITKDLNVTAGNFSQFFFKDNNGALYLKPTATAKDEFQFVSGTKQQAGGVFNKTTGKFTPSSGVANIGTSTRVGGVGGSVGTGVSGIVDSVEGVEIDEEVNGYAELVNRGSLTPKQALDEISKDKKNALISRLANTQSEGDTATDLVAKQKSSLAGSLGSHEGLNSAVGPTFLTRGNKLNLWDKLTGQTQSFIAGVEQLTSGLSLEALIEAKSRGATFGALSDTEMEILSSAATKIGTWRDKDENGKVTGYSIDEKSFKDELDNINKVIKRSIKSSITTQGSGFDEANDPLGVLDLGTTNSTNPLQL